VLIHEGYATGHRMWVLFRNYFFDFIDLFSLIFIPFLLAFYLLVRTSVFESIVYVVPR
jgi:hypothetical protein